MLKMKYCNIVLDNVCYMQQYYQRGNTHGIKGTYILRN